MSKLIEHNPEPFWAVEWRLICPSLQNAKVWEIMPESPIFTNAHTLPEKAKVFILEKSRELGKPWFLKNGKLDMRNFRITQFTAGRIPKRKQSYALRLPK